MAPGDEVQVRQGNVHLTQRTVERERLIAGLLGPGCQLSVRIALIAERVAFAQSRVPEGEARIDRKRLLECALCRVQLHRVGGLLKLCQPGQVQIECLRVGGGAMPDAVGDLLREDDAQNLNDGA